MSDKACPFRAPPFPPEIGHFPRGIQLRSVWRRRGRATLYRCRKQAAIGLPPLYSPPEISKSESGWVMVEFPGKAKVVIIGLGGIVGASVAHHLVERGWTDIVGIDKSGIPTDIGSTAHASDFCYMTSHDFLSCWSSLYSIDFYDKLGHYERVGGLEVARVGDDARMDEIKRKVASAKAFGTRARLIDAKGIKAKFPLIEESMVQGGLWDPDAGLVIPRSQTVAHKLVSEAEASGKLKAFANTPAMSLVIENGRIKGVVTERGTIMADYVVVCAGLWGRLIAEMAGEDLPVMPVDHPLTFFGPYTE